ncbi:sigma-70 family RNA polymerase sigma factor [Stieleria sp. TO1_6]|uniref:RNA polymerase sigma factor n=1 Tax=Stieleria tagensis TaxID=2956795 RepID=UPI00209A87A3|nr:sigma-70 family RNA polymerase sigma factor [Stieleria tagensis]MCO8120864.1 sigma-70 family RNA polymerase sigma factor [Stieleria tagensis]
MSHWPDTQPTLLQRIADPRDDAAWNRFDALYRPVIYRYARSRGLQHSDAEALVADVIARVFRAAQRWSTESEPGDSDRPLKFSAWLHRVSENALLNLVTRQLSRRGTGGTSHQLSLAGRPLPDDQSRTDWQREQQQHLFVTAASVVKSQVESEQWLIFWQTHVDGVSIARAAELSGRSIGSVYAIRSRVLRRLRQAVTRIERLEETQFAGESQPEIDT